MTPYAPESGLAPVVIGGVAVAWSTIVNTVITVGSTAWMLSDAFDTDDPAGELAAEANPQAVQACLNAMAQGGLTPGARALYVQELEGWKARGAQELGSGPALASYNKTIENLAKLYKQTDDGTGVPVGLCHVQAGSLLLERQLKTLKNTPANAIPPVSAQGVPAGRPRAPINWGIYGPIAVAVAALIFWRLK